MYKLKKLQGELRSTFTNVEEVRIGEKLSSCHYLRACLDEAMRLSPSIGGVLPREVLHDGLTIGDDHFPEGTDIGIPIHALHHNEYYYPDPYVFKPERWILGTETKKGVSEVNWHWLLHLGLSVLEERAVWVKGWIILARMVWFF